MRSGKSRGHFLLEAAQEQRAQFGERRRRAMRCSSPRFRRAARISRGTFAGAQIARLDEIDDAPEVQQPVLQRRAGQGQMLVGLQLFDRLGDLRVGILDELGLVQMTARKENFCNASKSRRSKA
jgi:hypothetical protein